MTVSKKNMYKNKKLSFIESYLEWPMKYKNNDNKI